jgi:hypothetical protein
MGNNGYKFSGFYPFSQDAGRHQLPPNPRYKNGDLINIALVGRLDDRLHLQTDYRMENGEKPQLARIPNPFS